MHTDRKRHYALLGLDPNASDEEIRSAFRRRAKELHPDSETGDASEFIRLKRAYDTLNDTAARARYDRACRARVRRAVGKPVEPPLPYRSKTSRSGGVGLVRYLVAFLFMGGLSFGAIEVMISYAGGPEPSAARPTSLLATETAKGTSLLSTKAATTVGPGFWDTTSPDGSPRDSAAATAPPTRKRPPSQGVFTLE